MLKYLEREDWGNPTFSNQTFTENQVTFAKKGPETPKKEQSLDLIGDCSERVNGTLNAPYGAPSDIAFFSFLFFLSFKKPALDRFFKLRHFSDKIK